MTMQVVNRKGEKEDVRFDAILEKLSSLTEGLDPNWIDPAHLTKLTIEGLSTLYADLDEYKGFLWYMYTHV